jgi:hypothetical protein
MFKKYYTAEKLPSKMCNKKEKKLSGTAKKTSLENCLLNCNSTSTTPTRTPPTLPQEASTVAGKSAMVSAGEVFYFNKSKKGLVSIILVLVFKHKNKQIHVRIHSTFKVIRTCMFIVLSVLEGTQRVPPTCTDFTYRVEIALTSDIRGGGARRTSDDEVRFGQTVVVLHGGKVGGPHPVLGGVHQGLDVGAVGGFFQKILPDKVNH